MATIAIGDVHGNVQALTDLLDRLSPDLHADDVLVFLGDYIDRGRDARACIDAILAFERTIPARVVALCGNHEDWMLRTMADYRKHSWWLGMQPIDTIRSYSPSAVDTLIAASRTVGMRLFLEACELPYDAFFDAVPAAHKRFFEGLRTYFQGPECVCVHAGIDVSAESADLGQHSRESLVWGVPRFPEAYAGSQTVVYGHHNNAQLDERGWPLPRIIGQTVGIDTIAHGVLTAIRFPDRRIYQSARYALREL